MAVFSSAGVGAMTDPRQFPGVAPLPDGRALVVGGRGLGPIWTSADLFTLATAPYAREVLGGGVESGRFTMPNPDVFFAILAGSAFALIRAILSGHAPKNADSEHAEAILRLLGVPNDEAREISRRPLPKPRSTRRVS